MLKHIKVPIIIDDHEPEKCGKCERGIPEWCNLFPEFLYNGVRCKQCLEEAK